MPVEATGIDGLLVPAPHGGGVRGVRRPTIGDDRPNPMLRELFPDHADFSS